MARPGRHARRARSDRLRLGLRPGGPLRRGLPALAAKIPEPCAGSSTSWAQAYLFAVAKMGGRGVAMGSDINGAAALPGPRFGTFAAFGARNDRQRTAERRGEIERQSNGVAYREPIRDHRWHRFEPTGSGGYDEESCNIWHAVAQYAAGYNPALDDHPPGDHPELSILQLLEAVDLYLDQDWIDHVTQGFWMADQPEPPDPDQIADRPREQRAAYFARLDTVADGGSALDEHTQALMEKIKAVWEKWQQMSGDNRPLARSTAGERRDFDINIDGMAHYGMLPDLLQDLRNIGLSAEDLAPLFRSAYDYVQMWGTCERRAAELTAGL